MGGWEVRGTAVTAYYNECDRHAAACLASAFIRAAMEAIGE